MVNHPFTFWTGFSGGVFKHMSLSSFPSCPYVQIPIPFSFPFEDYSVFRPSIPSAHAE